MNSINMNSRLVEGGWGKVKKGLVTLEFKSRPLANITLSMTWLLKAGLCNTQPKLGGCCSDILCSSMIS